MNRVDALVALSAALLAGGACVAPLRATAQDGGLTVAEARSSLLGRWEGRFEALDDGLASESFDWPVEVSIEDAGDGHTLVERQQFAAMEEEDGSLSVTVTSLDPDGSTAYGSVYVRGSPPEHRALTLSLDEGRDERHWTLSGIEEFERDGELLQARYSLVREGDLLISTYEVDPAGEEPPFGQVRRTLRRVEEER